MSVSSPPAPAAEEPSPLEDPARRLPGDIHIWVMVLGEFLFFSSYFVVYMIDRAVSSPAAYAAAQKHLDLGLGAVNTIVLMTSSLFVALAVIDTRHGHPKAAERKILAAAACGVLFIVIKAYEWYQEAQYYSINNEFLSHYYALTGVHVFHLVVGLVALGVLVRELRDPRRQRSSTVEQGALYWHMVDVIWLVIFAVLYLMR